MNILHLTNYRLVEYKDGRIQVTQHTDQPFIEGKEKEELIKFLKK